MRYLLIIALACALAGPAAAKSYVSLNEAGNEAFQKGDFPNALDLYHQAEMERPETPTIYYNQANALVETGKYDDAIEKFQKALNTDDVQLQAKTYYNGGNSYFKKEDYRQAIEWYQKALELNPTDMDAKYNLELARNRLREQMKRKPKDQQQQQQQQQQQDKKQEQQQQGDEKSNEGQQDQNQQQQQMQSGKKQDENQMSKEDALRILRALQEKEEDNLKNAKRFKVKGTYHGEDW
jgi:Ca-activated chloride channel family protein